MSTHERYMRRCFDLARLGAGQVSPNPMVGAVLVHEGRIIGEGFHQRYGEAHAEVNAVNSVRAEDLHLLAEATLYVSLEPCCIFGKTPPCTNLILEHQMPKVVISCLDQTPGVAGKGVAILREAGVEVISGVLEAEGLRLSAIRNTFVTRQRPYIILKFAKTQDGFLAPLNGQQHWITNGFSKRLVHRWRSEADAILVGTNTALSDNPQLNNRLYFGKSPLRLVLDKNLRLPPTLALFDGSYPTLVFTTQKSVPENVPPNVEYVLLDAPKDWLPQLLATLAERKITSLIVEGGAQLLQAFIAAEMWDEARVLTGATRLLEGIRAPNLQAEPAFAESMAGDWLEVFYRV